MILRSTDIRAALQSRRAQPRRHNSQRGFVINPFAYPTVPTTDPYWANVVLLTHMDGANNGTVFTDVKGHTVSGTGSAVTSTAQFKWGGASCSLPGSSQINVAHAADLNILGADFTVEGWFYFTSVGSSTKVFSKRNFPGTSAGWSLHYYSGGWTFQAVRNDLAFFTASFGTTAPPQNQWVFVQLNHVGVNVSLYVNGVQVGITQSHTGYTLIDNTTQLSIGGPVENNSLMTGYFDDVRITAGVARPVAVPTAAFPESGVIETSLLLRANTANASTPIDESSFANVPTGTTGIVQSAAAKYGAAGMDFTTSSLLDYTFSAGGPFDFGTSDFTIQCWINPKASTGDVQALFGIRENTDGYQAVSITVWTGVETFGNFTILTNTGSFALSYGNVSVGAWMHLAFVRDGNVTRVYKNGVQATASTNAAKGSVRTANTYPFNIVRMGGQSLGSGNPRRVNAYVDDFQVIKGLCLYPNGTTFTPPGAL